MLFYTQKISIILLVEIREKKMSHFFAFLIWQYRVAFFSYLGDLVLLFDKIFFFGTQCKAKACFKQTLFIKYKDVRQLHSKIIVFHLI